MTTRTSCLICEAHTTTSSIGLCARCEAYPVLVAAFTEGMARKAVQAPEKVQVGS
jgi:hypothetical protein